MGSMHVVGMTVEAPSVTLDGFEVLDSCHRRTMAMLERMGLLLEALEHGELDMQSRRLAAEAVRYFSTTARLHHEDEEQHVFPRLLQHGDAQTVQAVLRLQHDHGWLEADWRELAPLLEGVANGEGWVDLEALRRGIEIYTALSKEHMALEESLIYPQARTYAGPDERRAMVREMARRRDAVSEDR